MVSFYESCILEINKIAVEGKRVFRNHASSKKSSTVNRGSFTYVDDLPLSTNLCIRRFTYLNRRYSRRRYHARKHRLYRVRVVRSKTYRRVRFALKGKVTRFFKTKHNDKKKHYLKKKYNAKKVHYTETKDKSKKKHYANKTNYPQPKATYEEQNNYIPKYN
jgi:hypothetical protein